MSLRNQAVSTNHESRPLPPDNKTFGFIKRLTSVLICRRSRHSHRSNSTIRDQQQYNTHIYSYSAVSIKTSSSSNSLHLESAAPSIATEISNTVPSNHQCHNNLSMPNTVSSATGMAARRLSRSVSLPSGLTSSSGPVNMMHWMQSDCPKDVVPLILAFAGPQKIVAIGRTNRFWRRAIGQEATWRRLCESLYKWKEGDVVPDSWKKFYQYNPCVPIDYSSIHTALSEVIGSAGKDPSKPSVIRVLLRPGCYVLRKAITIDVGCTGYDDSNKNNHSLSVEIETMAYSPESYFNGDLRNHSVPSHLPSDQSKWKLKNSIRNIFGCFSVDVESEDEDEDFVDHDSLNQYLDNESSPSEDIIENANNNYTDGGLSETPSETYGTNGGRRIRDNRASLVLTTRRHDEPLLRILQGSFTMRNIDLKHGSNGDDIWNGNSAIHIQPTLGLNNDSVDIPAPTVTLDGVDVTSFSGRGIVNIDGGHVKISNSYIHDCAATGIYVGGAGSRAMIEQSDVIYNGKGNTKNRRGIASGHSGIYLEQGHASIIDCNISRNTLTGISAINPDNALLSLQASDLISNGTFQLEMPDIGTASHRNSITVNNTFASSGRGRSRSILLAE